MTMDDLGDRLKQLDADFKSAPTERGGFVKWKPPEGTYWTVLDEVDFFEAKNTGAAYLKLCFRIAHNDYAGRIIEKLYVLEPHKIPKVTHEQAIEKLGYLRQDLSVLGIDVEDISMGDIRPGSPIWDDIMDRNVELAVKFGRKTDQDGDPYRNVYINASLGKAKSDIPNDTTPDYKPTQKDEEVPF